MMQSRVVLTSALALTLAAGAVLSSACGSGSSPAPRTGTSAGAAAPGRSSSAGAARAPEKIDARPRVVFLGDSLTAGLGLSPDEAYPSLIQRRIDSAGLEYQVVNAGVSGDTSAGGLSRLDWALEGDVRVLVVALGGNDGLRGLPADELRRNLSTIIERAQAKHITVILAGMEAPPNFGQAYVVAFHQVYPELAKQYRVPLIPFLLQDVAGIEGLNQRDGIHPTAEGARTVAEHVWAVLRPTLKGS